MSPHTTPAEPRAARQRLVLVAMIFAVAMMFIDQTIVALAIPDLQKDLALSATGAQWIVNGYLLSLAALFVLGGKLADVLGHRRMVTDRRRRVRRLLGAVRRHAHRRARRGVDDRLPRRAGRVRGVAVPRGARDRRRGVPAARARPRAGDVLRHHRRADRRRAARRRLPDGVDVALDLLDQRARRGRRADPHRARRSPRRSARAARSTTAAPCSSRRAMGLVVLGLQQAGTWGWTTLRTWAASSPGCSCSPASSRSSCASRAAGPGADLRAARVRRRQRSSCC